MDYDWKYFVEDLEANSGGLCRNDAGGIAVKSVIYRMDAEKRNRAVKLVKGMLADYRQQCGGGREPVG